MRFCTSFYRLFLSILVLNFIFHVPHAYSLQIDYFPVDQKGITKKTINFLGKSIESGRVKTSPKNTGTEVLAIKKKLFNPGLGNQALGLGLKLAVAPPERGDSRPNHRSSLTLDMPLNIRSVNSPAISISITNSSYENNQAMLALSFKL